MTDFTEWRPSVADLVNHDGAAVDLHPLNPDSGFVMLPGHGEAAPAVAIGRPFPLVRLHLLSGDAPRLKRETLERIATGFDRYNLDRAPGQLMFDSPPCVGYARKVGGAA